MTVNFIYIIIVTYAVFSRCNCNSLESRIERLESAMLEKDERITLLENALLQKDEKMSFLGKAMLQKDNDVIRLERQLALMQRNWSVVESRLIKCSLDNGQVQSEMRMKNKPISNLSQSLDIKKDTVKEAEETDLKADDGFNKQLNHMKRTTVLGSTNIAFHAYLSTYHAYSPLQSIIFDTEEIDMGNGYDNGDGIYVVPVTGVYVFTWKLITDYNTYNEADLMINGAQKDTAIADSEHVADFSQGTGLVVVQVNKGDHVLVRVGSNAGGDIQSNNGYGRTTFSGWLLFRT